MLPDSHNHDGSSKGGKRINVYDLVDYEKFLFLNPQAWTEISSNINPTVVGNQGVLTFSDGFSTVAVCTFMMPATKKAIAKMDLLLWNQTSNGVLRLAFGFDKTRAGQPVVTDALAEASYTTSATINVMQKISIPRTAWDGLLQLNPFDILGFKLTRSGSNALDTYNSNMSIFGLLIEFS